MNERSRSSSSTNGSTATEMAIATATPDGRPSVRMVLLKSADERGFTFFTSYESRKGRELEANPRAALLFHGDDVQVRVEGRVERLLGRGVGRVLAVAAAPRRGAAPRPRTSRADRDRARSSRRASPRSRPSRPGPARWGGFRLVPDTYEFWRHRDDRLHERHLFRARDGRLGGGTPATVKLLAAAAVASHAHGRERAPAPKLAGCPVFPASSVWNARVDQLPVAANSAQLIASIGVSDHVHADFGNGLYDGSRIGIPYVVVHGKTIAEVARGVRLRRRERQGPVPDPGVRADRGRTGARERGRPSRADRRPRLVPALRALRAAPRGRPLGRRLRRDLRPALEQAAARRLDLRRRRGAPDPAGPRTLGRRRVDRAHRPRAAIHRRADAPRVHLSGAPRREQLERRVAAADGPARAAESEREHREAAARRRASSPRR